MAFACACASADREQVSVIIKTTMEIDGKNKKKNVIHPKTHLGVKRNSRGTNKHKKFHHLESLCPGKYDNAKSALESPSTVAASGNPLCV